MELSDHLLMLERQLQQAEVRADRQALEALLADDFLEFGVSGGRWDKAQVLASLPQQVFIERRISEFAVQCLGPTWPRSPTCAITPQRPAGGQQCLAQLAVALPGGALADAVPSGHAAAKCLRALLESPSQT
ncbi:hypothetical protein PBOI14_29260 [Pseudomonas sp. Boi14]|nr:hypothetical protein PBOI14_29260 [Pseudomonas sp. Boi14]